MQSSSLHQRETHSVQRPAAEDRLKTFLSEGVAAAAANATTIDRRNDASTTTISATGKPIIYCSKNVVGGVATVQSVALVDAAWEILHSMIHDAIPPTRIVPWREARSGGVVLRIRIR